MQPGLFCLWQSFLFGIMQQMPLLETEVLLLGKAVLFTSMM
jgi:hypothetical protein